MQSRIDYATVNNYVLLLFPAISGANDLSDLSHFKRDSKEAFKIIKETNVSTIKEFFQNNLIITNSK